MLIMTKQRHHHHHHPHYHYNHHHHHHHHHHHQHHHHHHHNHHHHCRHLHHYHHIIISLRDINATLGLLPSRRHVIWRDSVGVGLLCQGLKHCERVFSQQSFYVCYAVLLSHNNWSLSNKDGDGNENGKNAIGLD